MIDLPLGKLKFNDDVDFSFPTSLCCNCGNRTGLTLVEQDTRRTTYMVAGGTEITFKLPLPFCEECLPSSKRRPKNFVHRALGFLLSFGVAALALIIAGEAVFDSPAIAKYLVPFSLLFATCTTGAWIAVGRPRGTQTSYFQPVRIPKLKREFVSGIVTAIGFSFTNREYARAFAKENSEAIAKRVVNVART